MLIIAIFIVAASIAVTVIGPWLRIAAFARNEAEKPIPESAESDAGVRISVVSYIQRDEENLTEYIDLLLTQRCEGMEIVLVCDASAEATSMLSDKFEDIPHLHITFIPPGSHNLSRRKLAQTIGIKAAKGDIVVLTSSSVRPVSDRWIVSLTETLINNPAVVMTLGYVRPVTSDYKGRGKYYRQFDQLIESSLWMDAALGDEAFRGDGFNMAMRRRAFFDNKGYAATLPLEDGDDDIFIRELSRFGHVSLCLMPDSIVDSNWGDQADQQYADLKDRRIFTRHYLPQAPFKRLAIREASEWIMSLSGILTVCASLIAWLSPSIAESIRGLWMQFPEAFVIEDALAAIIAGAAVIVAIFCIFLAQMLAFKKMATALGAPRFCLSVPLFLLWHPIGNMLFIMRHRTTRKSHFTWRR